MSFGGILNEFWDIELSDWFKKYFQGKVKEYATYCQAEGMWKGNK